MVELAVEASRARVVAAARAEVAAGRLPFARDRLAGLLAQHPADPEALDLLGAVCRELGDEVAAGRWWFLSARDDPEADAARAAFLAAQAEPWKAANALRVRAPAEAFPAEVQVRLADLVSEVAAAGGSWVPGQRAPLTPSTATQTWSWTDSFVMGGILLSTVGVWLVGVITLVVLVVSAAS
ncbi:DUF6584 family protein [Frankia sp. Cas3]|uniref:DUF6584 family protein n=1 Tax=Frankia sp. Cas3 TaxID=3073926 RepID=UPI002AD39E10|nr:DUF6584 family protein [Frankia sp. Cas3]